MPVSMKFVWTDGTPLKKDLPLALPRDNAPIAKAKVRNGGRATFNVDASQYKNQKLAVRVDEVALKPKSE